MTKTWKDRSALALIRLVDGAFAAPATLLQRLLFRRLRLPHNETELRRILVFRIGAVGDVAAAVPVLHAIRRRFPHAHITLLTSPGRKGAPGAPDLIGPGDIVNELLVYHTADIATWAGRRALLGRVRQGRFDLFVEMSNIIAPFRQILQSIFLARLAGCRYAAGIQAAPTRIFPRTQALHILFPNESGRLLQTLSRPLDLQCQGSARLAVSGRERAAVRRVLHEHGLSAEDRFVVMHAGAKRPSNRWYEDRFAAVADAIQIRYGIRVVLTGSRDDLELIGRVCRAMRTRPTVVAGQLALLEVAALMEQACLYIGNDTGPMHLAAAMDTPVVAVFGARDFPGQWNPQGPGHIVLRRDVPCSPCFLDVCDRGLPCLDGISVDDVLAAVERQFSQRGISPEKTEAVERS